MIYMNDIISDIGSTNFLMVTLGRVGRGVHPKQAELNLRAGCWVNKFYSW